jgi:purine-nucleoside/S-methyl-5'-thioadenosine phosphorylase / adenosine deaminase
VRWNEKNGVRWLEAGLTGSTAVFSSRSGGSVKESHAPLATALGISPSLIHAAHQVHGTELRLLGDAAARSTPEADGHVITAPGMVGLVYVADCLPVAVAGPGGIAILHCGWRGLAAGIIARGAAAVGATEAVIGPGIGPCCYEVGDDVLRTFRPLGPGVASGRMLDLPEAARRLLQDSGVEAIESAGLCTCCEQELFFSHRRDAGPGRQAGLAWIEGGG